PFEDPHNAFRATVTVTGVKYIMASILNGQTSTGVQKRAVAAPDCPSSGVANFPMAICDDGNLIKELPPNGCTDQGRFSQPPPAGSQTSCWTSLSTSSANASAFMGLLPTQCGGNGGVELSEGDSINLQNGTVSNFLQAVQCCVACVGAQDFTIPVVDCGEIGS